MINNNKLYNNNNGDRYTYLNMVFQEFNIENVFLLCLNHCIVITYIAEINSKYRGTLHRYKCTYVNISKCILHICVLDFFFSYNLC